MTRATFSRVVGLKRDVPEEVFEVEPLRHDAPPHGGRADRRLDSLVHVDNPREDDIALRLRQLETELLPWVPVVAGHRGPLG